MKVIKYICFNEERKVGLAVESLANLISKVRAKYKVILLHYRSLLFTFCCTLCTYFLFVFLHMCTNRRYDSCVVKGTLLRLGVCVRVRFGIRPFPFHCKGI